MAIWSLNESPGPLRYAIIGRAVKKRIKPRSVYCPRNESAAWTLISAALAAMTRLKGACRSCSRRGPTPDRIVGQRTSTPIADRVHQPPQPGHHHHQPPVGPSVRPSAAGR